MIFGISVGAILMRVVRGAVVAIAAHYVQTHGTLTVTDFLHTGIVGGVSMGIAKTLRDKFPGWFEWLPV